jgi:ketol-acid reductoisomerase
MMLEVKSERFMKLAKMVKLMGIGVIGRGSQGIVS